MTEQVNIKNPRAVSDLHRLASHYNTSFPQAIIRAAEEILKEPGDEEVRRRIQRIDAALDVYRELATNLDGATDEMYDANGLPLW